MSNTIKFSHWLPTTLDHFENVLSNELNDNDVKPSRLHEAIHYSVMAGGKRLRPLLIYATANSLNVNQHIADSLAITLELIHTYSLVHDDLPGMDNDQMRRGLPTCHIHYDEATAILVGDALQSKAFECLAKIQLPANAVVLLIKELAETIGDQGITQGQALDLSWSKLPNQACQLADLETMHRKKTGLLFELCVRFVMIASQMSFDLEHNANDQSDSRSNLLKFARNIGIAYQIQDDLLDVLSSSEEIGKPAKSDIENNKLTYPKLLGIDDSKQQLQYHLHKTKKYLHQLPSSTDLLEQLTEHIFQPQFLNDG